MGMNGAMTWLCQQSYGPVSSIPSLAVNSRSLVPTPLAACDRGIRRTISSALRTPSL